MYIWFCTSCTSDLVSERIKNWKDIYTATPSRKSLLLSLSRELVSRYWKKSMSRRLSIRMYSTSTITGSNRLRSWGSCSFSSSMFPVLSSSPWVTRTPFFSYNSFMNVINCSSTEIPWNQKMIIIEERFILRELDPRREIMDLYRCCGYIHPGRPWLESCLWRTARLAALL